MQDKLATRKLNDFLFSDRNKARNAFYACLERESNKKPTEIASVGLLYPVECKNSRDQFAKQCRPTWVKHFDRQYASKKRLHRLLDDNESRRELKNKNGVETIKLKKFGKNDACKEIVKGFGNEKGKCT
ncbi:hypothetical protein HYC85_017171 [Camellia sinensis]|uniref:Cytochrome c oxidase assembly factor 6 n=1 Tax=Camellia sinensis TaxID=4442 RepID=A0A7J7H1U4_CAMSI|nr:hypothetical protein HYC85_017171 [Camellia sinensis]